MSAIDYPRSDISRDEFLIASYLQAQKDTLENKNYLTVVTMELLELLKTEFNELIFSQISSEDELHCDIREKNETLLTLRTYCLHGLSSIRNRVSRLNEPIEILSNYGIPLSGNNPRLSLSTDLPLFADQIIAGDTLSIHQGYEPMVNPTASELSKVNEIAKAELKEISIIEHKNIELITKVHYVRSKVDLLIREIISDLNHALKHNTEEERVSIFNSYGVHFRQSSKK